MKILVVLMLLLMTLSANAATKSDTQISAEEAAEMYQMALLTVCITKLISSDL